MTKADESIFKKIPKNIPLLIVGNKSDLKDNNDSSEKDTKNIFEKDNIVIVSAKTGEGAVQWRQETD